MFALPGILATVLARGVLAAGLTLVMAVICTAALLFTLVAAPPLQLLRAR